LFISVHVYDDKKIFFPGTGKDTTVPDKEKEKEKESESADPDQPRNNKKRRREDDIMSAIGSVAVDEMSNVLNVALKRNTATAGFIQAFKTRVIPRLDAFRPQIIILSAGFDGHRDDPSNGMKLSDEDYFTITKLIMRVAKKWCGGRVVSVLEGGYGLEQRAGSLKKCIHAHMRALISDDDYVSPAVAAVAEGLLTTTNPSTTTTTTTPVSSTVLPPSSVSSSLQFANATTPVQYPPSTTPQFTPFESSGTILPSSLNNSHHNNGNNNNTNNNINDNHNNIIRNSNFNNNNNNNNNNITNNNIPPTPQKQQPKKGSIESILL
jgi:hypothetical protein